MARVSALLVVVSAVAIVSVLFWNTADPPPSRLSNEPAQTFVQPVVVPLTPTARQELIGVAARFLDTAVKREHSEIAYDLAAPSLREGTTRSQWAAGELPVVPYPVDEARWKVDYSFRDQVGLQVLVYPRVDSALEPMIFNMSLQAVGAGDEREWLVDSWTPKGGAGLKDASRETGSPFAIARPGERVSARLGAGWLLFPVLLLLTGALLVPLGLFLVGRQRDRRAERAYQASRR